MNNRKQGKQISGNKKKQELEKEKSEKGGKKQVQRVNNSNRWLERMEQQNRKNLTDGRVVVHFEEEDLVKVDNPQDIRDQDRDDLERECTLATSYLENVSSGRFRKVEQETVRLLLERQSKHSQNTSYKHTRDNLQQDINEVIQKTSLFFQGTVCGLQVMQVIQLFMDSDQIRFMNSYGQGALRLNQVFYLFSLCSLLGAFHGFWQAWRLAKQSDCKPDYFKYLIPSFAFLLDYLLVIYNHPFVVSASVYSLQISTKYPLIASPLSTFKYISLVQAILAVIGWLTFVIFSQSDSQHSSNTTNPID